MSRTIEYTTDHDVIRRWVEERGGWPTRFLRVNFHGYVTRGAARRIDWDKFFQAFEQRRLAFLYQEQTTTGKRSYYCRLVIRRAVPSVEGTPDAHPDAAAKIPPVPAGAGLNAAGET